MQKTGIEWASTSRLWTDQFEGMQSPHHGFIDMRKIFSLLRRYINLIGMCVALSIISAFIILLILPKTYTSWVEIFIDPRGLKIIEHDIEGRDISINPDLMTLQSQKNIIKSNVILKKLIEDEKLDTHPFFVENRSNVNKIQAISTKLSKIINVEYTRNSYIISIIVTTNNSKLSARIANRIAEIYLEYKIDNHAEIVKNASTSLFDRADKLRNQVHLAEERLEAYKALHNIIGAEGSLVSEQQLSDLAASLIVTQANTAESKARYDQVRQLRLDGQNAGSITEAIQSATISSLRTQAAEVARQEAELAMKYGSQHPYVREVRAQSKKISRLIQEELRRIIGATHNDYMRAKAKEKSLAKSLEDLKKNTLDMNEAIIELRELQRDAVAKRDVYHNFLNRAKELEEQQTINTMNARIINPAIPASNHNGPSKVMVLIAALLMGIGLGIGLAWIIEQFSSGTIDSKQEFTERVRYPLLGVVPSSQPTNMITPKSLNAVIASISRIGSKRSEAPVISKSDNMYPAYHQLANRLDMAVSSKEPRSILFISPDNSAQKTAAICQLTRTMIKEMGTEILLIDGNPTDQYLTKNLCISRKYGFLDVIQGRCNLSDALWVDDHSDLVVLPMSSHSLAPNSTANKRQLARQGMSFDPMEMPELIMIDAESINNSLLLPRLLNIIDDIVLVFECGVTTHTSLENMMLSLQQYKDRIRGTIILEA